MDLTKILKVGDRVYSPIGGNGIVIKTDHAMPHPILVKWENGDSASFTKDGKYYTFSPECLLFPSKENRDWNSFKRKKEISFKPFDKVLVRDTVESQWRCTFFSHYVPEAIHNFITVNAYYKQCIPYNSETEHLIGTAKDCPSKYKIWE